MATHSAEAGHSANPHPTDSTVMQVEAHTGDSAHIVPPLYYVINFLALMFLMALTYFASDFHLGVFNNVVALAIAITKASLVVLIFMGVRWGTKLTWLWAALGFIWFLLLFGILSDYISREWIAVRGWEQPWYNP